MKNSDTRDIQIRAYKMSCSMGYLGTSLWKQVAQWKRNSLPQYKVNLETVALCSIKNKFQNIFTTISYEITILMECSEVGCVIKYVTIAEKMPQKKVQAKKTKMKRRNW